MRTRLSKWAVACAGLALVIAEPARAVTYGGGCARFHDWQDTGCRRSPGGPGAPASGADQAGGNQAHCPTCPSPTGVARWWVDEPQINLWITDEPLSYFMSSGQKMTFRWTYKQRYQLPQPDECPNYYHPICHPYLPRSENDAYLTDMRAYGMTNASWGHNWMTDIVFWDAAWESNPAHSVFYAGYEALVFRPEGGIYYFQNTPGQQLLTDPQSLTGLQPLSSYPLVSTNWPTPDASGIYWGNTNMGFRLVYPDGSQDTFSLAFCIGGTDPFGQPHGSNSTAHALLTQRIDPQGRATRLGYECLTNSPVDAWAFRVKYVVDPDTHTNTFIYNAPYQKNAWQVTEIDDPYGRKAQFAYDIISGVLTSITDASSNTSSFAYAGDGSGWITSQTTPYGTTSFACYQAPYPAVTNGFSQRAARVGEPMGAAQLFYYAHTNGLLAGTASTPAGVPGQTFDDGTCGTSGEATLSFRNSFHWDRLQFEALSPTVAATLTNSLPAGLGALSANDFRKAGLKHWLWQADQISISQSLSSEREPSADAAGLVESPRTWYNYADKGNGCDTEGDAQIGCIARFLPDGSTQYGLYQYNPRTGLVQCNAETCALANGQTGTRTNWFNYATNGVDLASMSNSAGQWAGFAWNTNHQVTFVTNALGQVTSLAWDPVSRNLAGLSLPSGQSVTQFLYSGSSPYNNFVQSLALQPQGLNLTIATYASSLPQAVHANGGGVDLWVTNSWDSLNRLTATLFPDGTTISNIYTWLDLTAQKDRLGNWTYYAYDGLQHPTSITDSLNRVTQLSWCDCGSLDGIIDALNQPTTLNYNNQGLLTNVTFPDGSSLWYQYDSAQRLTQALNGQNQGLTYGYNNQGLVTVVSSAYGPVWRAGYDIADRPSSLTNADQVTLAFQYDLLNRVTNRLWSDGLGESFIWATNGLAAYTNRDGKATLFTRDGAGRLLGVTNANREVTALAYAALNQVTDLWDGRTNHTVWSYDNYGRVAAKTDARASTVATYAYDPNGQLTNRWTPQAGNTAYAYDRVGNLQTITYPQSSVSYFYDALHRLTNMVDAAGANFFGYTPVGQLQSEYGRWANDTVSMGYAQQLRQTLSLAQPGGANWSQAYGYDAALRLQSLAASSGAFAYGYAAANPASALVRTLGLPNGAWVTNHYDSLDRLDYTGLLNRWGHVLDGCGHTEDPLGLRTNVTRNLGLTANSNGNLTNDGTRSFAYDAEDRLATNWVAGAWKSEFVYDGLGRRRIERDYSWNSSAWLLTNETHCIYDGWLVVQERNGANAVQVTYTRGLDLSGTLQYAGGIGGLLARTDGNGSTFYHSDGAGNIAGLIDASENMAARYLYGPFGRLTAQWGPLAAVNEMQFSSMPRHANSGMTLYPLRAYDPTFQRFLNHDPIGENGGINLYGFVGNNPMSYVDPHGLTWALFSGEAWAQLLHDLFIGDRPQQPVDPNSFGALHGIDNNFNGQTGAQVAQDIGMAVPNGILNAAAMMLGPGEAEGAYAAAEEALQAARAARAGRKCFKSFDALKQAYPNGPGQVWHHIVEQRDANVLKFGAEAIQNLDNVVELTPEMNQAIADYYSRIRPFTGGQTVRNWLGSQSFQDQSAFGLGIVRQMLGGGQLP